MRELDRRGEVVAVLLTHRGRVCLLRRSGAVTSDRGQWHCVTGFVSPGTSPAQQAAVEVFEETGLRTTELESFVVGPVLRLPDERGGYWLVHSYQCETAITEVSLNWENDAACWFEPTLWTEYPIVRWLPSVVTALGGV